MNETPETSINKNGSDLSSTIYGCLTLSSVWYVPGQYMDYTILETEG